MLLSLREFYQLFLPLDRVLAHVLSLLGRDVLVLLCCGGDRGIPRQAEESECVLTLGFGKVSVHVGGDMLSQSTECDTCVRVRERAQCIL